MFKFLSSVSLTALRPSISSKGFFLGRVSFIATENLDPEDLEDGEAGAGF